MDFKKSRTNLLNFVIWPKQFKICRAHKSIFSFKIFILLPIFPPLGLCYPGSRTIRPCPLGYALGCFHPQDRQLEVSSETSLTTNRTTHGVETGKITIHVLTVVRYSNFT
jgi:hypothetical protein